MSKNANAQNEIKRLRAEVGTDETSVDHVDIDPRNGCYGQLGA